MVGKKNLSDAVFDSLDAMMIAYADEAVNAAARQGETLDFSDASLPALERCLAATAEPTREDAAKRDGDGGVDYQTRLWGAYLGEVVRKRFGGIWQMIQYPGSTLAVPAIEVRGSHIYPMMKVFRRITMGESENVVAFYEMAAKRLSTPESIPPPPRVPPLIH